MRALARLGTVCFLVYNVGLFSNLDRFSYGNLRDFWWTGFAVCSLDFILVFWATWGVLYTPPNDPIPVARINR